MSAQVGKTALHVYVFRTAGRYRSTPHRVLLPRAPCASQQQDGRVSLVFFCNCDFYAPVAAIGEGGAAVEQATTTAGR